jgi:hypothetical protein
MMIPELFDEDEYVDFYEWVIVPSLEQFVAEHIRHRKEKEDAR